MRAYSVAVLVTVAVCFGSSGVAVAAPKDYCADLKGSNTGTTCEIHLSDPGYSVDISIPLDYPDQESVAAYISQTRDGFLNAAKSGAPRTAPYELSIKPTEYTSAIPPRGTQAVVFKVNQDVGGAHPQTTYKAFNWDQSYRKAIIYTAAPDDKKSTPLWRVDDPLTTVAPLVQAGLQQQLAPPPPPAAPSHAARATGTAGYVYTDHHHHAATTATTAVALRANSAVQPRELSEFRGGQRRGDLLLRPGRVVTRSSRGLAGAGAPGGDRPDACLTLLRVAEGQLRYYRLLHGQRGVYGMGGKEFRLLADRIRPPAALRSAVLEDPGESR